ncbi:MAG TPA: DUF1801 domain-containing protein [Daejeonella sp.]|nr:DUF1801 domain-containing protein [Daejeonella sp.]
MIVLDCGLTEELKWGCPCYTFQKKNIVLIHGFKEYCALLFIKGALLQDTHGILIQQTENVQAGLSSSEFAIRKTYPRICNPFLPHPSFISRFKEPVIRLRNFTFRRAIFVKI